MFYHPRMMSGLSEGDRLALAHASADDGSRFVQQAPAEPGDAGVHRTLIPVDGSEEADRAIEYAAALAQRGLTAEIHLLNVQPLVMQGDFAFDHVVQAEQTARLAAAQEAMQGARERLGGEVPVQVAVRFGHAAEAIARYAHEQGISAIAMATRATRSLRDRFRRSVAMDVVRRVGVPVTLLKAPHGGR
jgi:nucleotide-binding universal stress UspA family protein